MGGGKGHSLTIYSIMYALSLFPSFLYYLKLDILKGLIERSLNTVSDVSIGFSN